MNVALRLLMRKASAVNPIPIRAKSVRVGTGASLTVTFDEGTALDSTHLLICVVQWSGSISGTPSGWNDVTPTDITPGGAFKVYARQADGSVNSITISGSSNVKSAYLLGFKGYSTYTPPQKKIATLSGSSPQAMPTLPSTPAGDGVVLAIAISLTASTVWVGWSNGFTMAATPATSSLLAVGYKGYTGPSGSYSTSVSTTTAVASTGAIMLFTLV